MSFLSWFDNRTLCGCQFLLLTMFCVVFVWMGRTYPTVRGIRSVTLSFLLAIPGTLMLVSRSHIPDLLSVVVANLLLLLALVSLYEGTVQFIGGRVLRWPVGGALVSCMAVVCFSTEIHPNIVPRIVAVALFCAFLHSVTAIEVLRGSGASANRRTRHVFGSVLVALAICSLGRGVLTAYFGAPADFMKSNLVQTSSFVVSIIYVCSSGLSFLLMASHEVIRRSTEDSYTDPLSGVFNRRGIEAKLAIELRRAHRNGNRLCVSLVDIDHFKSINDGHGHAAGDAAIRQVAQATSRHLRGSDHVGRYGGDEFLVVLPETASAHALMVMDRLNGTVKNLHVGGRDLKVTLSIGVTEASPEDDAITLIARADEALYQAKSAGRHCMRAVLPQSTFAENTTARLSTAAD